MTVAWIELIVTSPVWLRAKSTDPITETIKDDYAEYIDGCDGETHPCKVLSLSQSSSIGEVDELN